MRLCINVSYVQLWAALYTEIAARDFRYFILLHRPRVSFIIWINYMLPRKHGNYRVTRCLSHNRKSRPPIGKNTRSIIKGLLFSAPVKFSFFFSFSLLHLIIYTCFKNRKHNITQSQRTGFELLHNKQLMTISWNLMVNLLLLITDSSCNVNADIHIQ